jgi:hypothetical protein
MIKNCRVCKSEKLETVLDFGEVPFTGVFPSTITESVPSGALCLVLCTECGLVQLSSSFPPAEMYGDNYGYRSGLNLSMVKHLQRIVRGLEQRIDLKEGDVVLDIGSNDGSLLSSYSSDQIRLIGIDPTIEKFRQYYSKKMEPVADFFSARTYKTVSSSKAKIVTSIAMFYDLEDPVDFANNVSEILDDEGIWFLEQSYMPWMLKSGAYDTICHEHLEYYSLSSLKAIFDRSGFVIIDAATNSVNGGSIALTVMKKENPSAVTSPIVSWLLESEKRAKIDQLSTWNDFAKRVRQQQIDLLELLNRIKDSGATVLALGASTKGNVLIQTTGITDELISKVGDVNQYKHGRFLPGSNIPIVSEEEVLIENPNYLLVLPWHFRETFVNGLDGYLSGGGKFIFPLPDIEIVGY